MTLEGQVAVITGAARGLGRAYALRLAKLGADIVINDINMESAKEYPEELTADTVVDEVKALGRRSIGIEGDVADQATVDAIFKQTLAEFGKVDILVANAGGMRGDRTESHAAAGTERNMRANLDSNLMGTVLCCQAASVSMKERNYGRIVTVSSVAGLRGSMDGYYASYGTAKAAIIGYTRYLAGELAPFGIRVNCIAPGYINTRRMAVWNNWDKEEGRKPFVDDVPLGRLGEVEDCAKVVEFFVSDMSSYVTGQTLGICGGMIRYH